MSLAGVSTGCGTSPPPAATTPGQATSPGPGEPSTTAPSTTTAPAETAVPAPSSGPVISDATATAARDALVARHGQAETERIGRGIEQMRRFWRAEDGNAEQFVRFVEEEFTPQGPALDAVFARFEFALERVDGYFTSMVRDLRRGVDLEIGPLLALDHRLAAFSPAAHVSEDLFANKIAFVALLNFPLSTLEQRLSQGGSWSRRQWAEARLADRFSSRVPGHVAQAITAATAAGDSYINAYNIYMHHLVDDSGQRLFPAGLRLISHWGLRDELKARYADADGLPRQRMIQKVMERIVRQEIPAAVVNNPLLDWNPVSNQVSASSVKDAEAPATAAQRADTTREDDVRYRHWLNTFQAVRLADPYYPEAPTHIARRFNQDREIPEREVEALFEAVLSAPEGQQAARLIEQRLGRKLEPFDIWYANFKPRGKYSEATLDAATKKRYPTAAAFAADMPRILRGLGFSAERAKFLAERIAVEPSRGAGHAFGPARRDDRAHLRTRVGANGMDYKGYNIAVHELGHNVEQVFSMATVDHTLLQGVPNTAFTEALAFVFQQRDLELLGYRDRDPQAEHLEALNDFWSTREIAGVALVDMKVWRWMYEHPDATPATLREAVVGIARDVWNRYYADIFGVRDVPILAIYSHMIDGAMYTPDYPLGHLIAFQIEAHFRGLKGASKMGAEFERICQLGRLTPDAWMRKAVGAPLSAEPMLAAARAALTALAGKGK